MKIFENDMADCNGVRGRVCAGPACCCCFIPKFLRPYLLTSDWLAPGIVFRC